MWWKRKEKGKREEKEENGFERNSAKFVPLDSMYLFLPDVRAKNVRGWRMG